MSSAFRFFVHPTDNLFLRTVKLPVSVMVLKIK